MVQSFKFASIAPIERIIFVSSCRYFASVSFYVITEGLGKQLDL